jgi:hypothetical protein
MKLQISLAFASGLALATPSHAGDRCELLARWVKQTEEIISSDIKLMNETGPVFKKVIKAFQEEDQGSRLHKAALKFDRAREDSIPRLKEFADAAEAFAYAIRYDCKP